MTSDFESVLQNLLQLIRNGLSKQLGLSAQTIADASDGTVSAEEVRNHSWRPTEIFGDQVFMYLRIGKNTYQLWDAGTGAVFTEATRAFATVIPWLNRFPKEMKIFTEVSNILLSASNDTVRRNQQMYLL